VVRSRSDPCVGRLNRFPGPPTPVNEFDPDGAGMIVGIQRSKVGQMPGKGRTTLATPIVGSQPEQQFGAGHERNRKVATFYKLKATVSEQVILIKKDRNDVRIK
jgi:hypothetical protein